MDTGIVWRVTRTEILRMSTQWPPPEIHKPVRSFTVVRVHIAKSYAQLNSIDKSYPLLPITFIRLSFLCALDTNFKRKNYENLVLYTRT